MKEHPILFSGDMVRAILDGRKTQTRRTRGLQAINKRPDCWNYRGLSKITGKHRFEMTDGKWDGSLVQVRCPYGQPSDRLWVREAFFLHKNPPFKYLKADYRFQDGRWVHRKTGHYAPVGLKWSPSIHMHRQSSRLTLEIVSIRVERVKEITTHDVRSEGMIDGNLALDENGEWVPFYGPDRGDFLKVFSRRWNKLNEKRGLGWDANPWVWVIEFSRLTT